MKKEFKKPTPSRLLVFSSICILFFSIFTLEGCRKSIDMQADVSGNIDNDKKTTPFRKINGAYTAIDNPYKISNVLATIEKYKLLQSEFSNYILQQNQIDVYVRIKTTTIPAEKLNAILEKIDFYNFPLDAAMLFEPGLTEEKLNTIKGEYLYTYLPKNSAYLTTYAFEKIYDVYKPKDEEQWLDEALLYDGEILNDDDREIITQKITNSSSNSGAKMFGFLKPKKPEGKIQYFNTQLGDLPVIDVKVCALKLFSVVSAQTDINGNFLINSNFFVGTFVFTKFTNSKINVFPIDLTITIGTGINWLAAVLVGSISPYVWHSKSQLPFVNINYNNNNKQTNYWSHIINMDFFHRQFNMQEGIMSAPTQLKFWAVWENKDENSAGTLMMNKINIQNSNPIFQNFITSNNINSILGQVVFNGMNFIAQAGLKALSPDIHVSSGQQYRNNFSGLNVPNYSPDISKTILHEMSHAGMYSKVGDLYWLNLGIQESNREFGGNYGWGNIDAISNTWLGSGFSNINDAIPNTIGNTLDDYIELSEAWAEFLGENYTRRIYNQNVAVRMHNPLGGGANGNLNNFTGFSVGETPYLFQALGPNLEGGHAWADIWIPCGMFNDLMDVTNSFPESWDDVGGYTIAEMYNAFDNSRPAHEAYLTFIAPMHGYIYSQLFPLFDNNLNQ
jgi:hypothetical protein